MLGRNEYARAFCRAAKPLFDRSQPLDARIVLAENLQKRFGASTLKFRLGRHGPMVEAQNALQRYTGGLPGMMRAIPSIFGFKDKTAEELSDHAAHARMQFDISLDNRSVVNLCNLFAIQALGILRNEKAMKIRTERINTIPDVEKRRLAIECIMQNPPDFKGGTNMRAIWDNNSELHELAKMPDVQKILGWAAFSSIS